MILLVRIRIVQAGGEFEVVSPDLPQAIWRMDLQAKVSIFCHGPHTSTQLGRKNIEWTG
jgi:hypothetical protein